MAEREAGEFGAAYGSTEHYFGRDPDPLLERFQDRIDRSRPVLDIGAGQGRNALFLARAGFAVHGIDPSPEAVETIRCIAGREDLPVDTFRCSFREFVPPCEGYSAILLFGLLQMISRDDIDALQELAGRWLRDAGLLFVTAWSVDDPLAGSVAAAWEPVGRNSYRSPEGRIRTYLEHGEILDLFPEYSVVHHWEGLGPPHRHGDGPVERHGAVRAVLQRSIG